MHSVQINDEEFARLKEANETKQYGDLESWKELYLFQRAIATPEQIKEIAELAAMANRGEKIPLPLNQATQENLL